MSFVSLQFLIVVAATILLYFVVPLGFRWYVLLAASSYFYYVAAGIPGILVALVTIAIAYFAGIWIEKSADDRKKRKLYMSVSAVALIGILAVFKISGLVGTEISWLIAPLGISYYTLSIVGYLADIYWKKDKAEKDPLKLILYTLYFPKITQGPFSKFREIGPRLIEGHKFDYKSFTFGAQLILWGYFKKIVIADRAFQLTGPIFGDLANYQESGGILLMATVFAVIRHYCDFSGYMDIVIGISQMMGIKLEDNFKQPYFSRSSAEFWRRWHMTLGVWFKDYVYMPLVISPKVIKLSTKVRKKFGKRAGKSVLTIVPLAVTWLLTGIWHGNGLSYVLWGCYWGIIIILTNVFEPEIKKLNARLHIPEEAWWWKVWQTIRTMTIFTFGLLLSTLVGYKDLGLYFSILFGRFRMPSEQFGLLPRLSLMGMNESSLFLLILSIVVLFVAELMQMKGSVRERIAKLPPLVRWIVFGVALYVVICFGVYGAGYTKAGFAYAHF